MHKIVKSTMIALATVVVPPAFGVAFASGDHDKARALKQSGEIMSLETILEKARKDQPGRVVETELERKGERYVYEIKIVDDKGGVRELKYDAKTGEPLKREREKSGE